MFFHRFNKFSTRDKLPIRIVTATRHSIDNFAKTQLGKTIELNSLLFNFEVYVQDQNTDSLSTVYNKAIELSLKDPAILVFVHDDVLITDFHWDQILREELKKFDIVGLAGTVRRLPKQPSWCMIDAEMTQPDDPQYLSGTVGHGTNFPPDNIGFFGKVGKKCRLLDGLFISADSRTLTNNNLNFDERFDFHFYDLDFCRQAETKFLTMGTAPISVVHGSNNSYTENWHAMYKKYLDKWNE